jgi:hypothetical protein
MYLSNNPCYTSGKKKGDCMKNWIAILLVVLIIAAGIIVISQRQVEAVDTAEAVIIHCDAASIKVISYEKSSNAPDKVYNENCAAALARLMRADFTIEKADTVNAFNYTLVKTPVKSR